MSYQQNGVLSINKVNKLIIQNNIYRIIIFYHPMSSQPEVSQSKFRNFICSCSKAYLSYAALFTHIKQKHGGKAPGQIIRPRSQNKRGRPRKNDKLATEKGPKYDPKNGFLDNNNLKNINFANELNFEQNSQRFQLSQGKGFRSYKVQKQSLHLKRANSTPNKGFIATQFHQQLNEDFVEEDFDDEMEFVNPNNQFSTNTIALASVIIGLQQLFKDTTDLEQIRNEDLQKFQSYVDLKTFHSLKLSKTQQINQPEDAFYLGNIICSFLNFCQQTIQDRAAYQQIVMLLVCLLEHIQNKKKTNILTECKKEVIHQHMTSFFQQYLDKIIIKSKLNYWIFKQNHSFQVLIWFLNWLSMVQNKHHKTVQSQKMSRLSNNFQQKQPNNFVHLDYQKYKNDNNNLQKQGNFMKKKKIQDDQESLIQSKSNTIKVQFQCFVQPILHVEEDANPDDEAENSDQDYDPNESLNNDSGQKQILSAQRLSNSVH